MRWIGYILTIVGLICIGIPIAAVFMWVLSRPYPPVALEYAPSFVLGGILVFVIGIGMRAYANG